MAMRSILHNDEKKIESAQSNGQIMILTVLMLGGTLLGATTIAGLLMLFQVRQTADISNSAKAFYAADSGYEWALFQAITHAGEDTLTPLPGVSAPGVLGNGAIVVQPLCSKQSAPGAPREEILCTQLIIEEGTRHLQTVGRSTNASRGSEFNYYEITGG